LAYARLVYIAPFWLYISACDDSDPAVAQGNRGLARETALAPLGRRARRVAGVVARTRPLASPFARAGGDGAGGRAALRRRADSPAAPGLAPALGGDHAHGEPRAAARRPRVVRSRKRRGSGPGDGPSPLSRGHRASGSRRRRGI